MIEQDDIDETRRAHAERWSEALTGGAELHRILNRSEHGGRSADYGRRLDRSARQWTRWYRQDRWADYAGSPPVMPGPILTYAAVAYQLAPREEPTE